MRQQSIAGSEQLDFSAPFQPASETSREAAKAIEGSGASLRAQLLAFLRLEASQGWDGWTDEELQRVLPMNPSTERPRRIELVRLGLVEDSGEKRRTASGRLATVWRAVRS